MDVYYSFNYLSAGWMAVQAVPLIASPTMIITLLSPEVRETTPLEAYLSRSLGFSLLAIAALILLLTGSIPLASSLSTTATGVDMDLEDPTAPYAVPTLSLTLAYHGMVAFYCYTQYTLGFSLAFGISSAVSCLLFAVGLWCLLFAASNGKISRKTGADQRTSGFPFKNKQADKGRQDKRENSTMNKLKL
jgi:hypothetical protein